MGIRGPKPYGIGCVTSHADLGFYEPQAEGRCPFRARLRNGHGRRTLSQQRRELHRPGESMSGPASIHFPVGPECQNPPPIRVHLCSSVVPVFGFRRQAWATRISLLPKRSSLTRPAIYPALPSVPPRQDSEESRRDPVDPRHSGSTPRLSTGAGRCGVRC